MGNCLKSAKIVLKEYATNENNNNNNNNSNEENNNNWETKGGTVTDHKDLMNSAITSKQKKSNY